MNHRFYSIFLALIFIFGNLYAQWVPTGSSKVQPVKLELVSSSAQSIVVDVEVKGFHKEAIPGLKGPAYTISLEGATPLLEAGAPDLPK
ncbi:MAG: hypothetical protein IH599_05880, partial [Bacteroidales bacterium]|nr:hypothetical protein [Bacteroidales bacterium]